MKATLQKAARKTCRRTWWIRGGALLALVAIAAAWSAATRGWTSLPERPATVPVRERSVASAVRTWPEGEPMGQQVQSAMPDRIDDLRRLPPPAAQERSVVFPQENRAEITRFDQPWGSEVPGAVVPTSAVGEYRVARLPGVLDVFRSLVPQRSPEELEAIEAVDQDTTFKIPVATSTDPTQVQLDTRNGLIYLVARDTPMNEVLAAIAQSVRLNVVCADNVTTRISITLHGVTLEDALDAILSIGGYTWTRKNNIVRITSISEASNLAPETQGRATEVITLDYVNAADVDEVIKGLLSPVGKSYPVQTSTDDLRKTREALVVEDVPSYLQRIRAYVQRVDQPPRQVLIEAHVLEVDLDETCRHGVNFQHVAHVAGNALTIQTTGFAVPAAPQAFFATVEASNLEALVEALKATTDAKTLASPKVLVVNGQQARIQVGEQLGYRVTTTTETSTLESVEFLDTGVVLNVTPYISRDHRVLMQVKPQVSTGEINPDTGLPEEETTEVETNVLLADGQGVLIGGLIQETDSYNHSRVGWLGDLWGIGWLFGRKHITKERSEIVISLVARVMPYDETYEMIDSDQRIRSETPLFHGPLQQYPRPGEASLRNTVIGAPHGCLGGHGWTITAPWTETYSPPPPDAPLPPEVIMMPPGANP